MILKYMAFEFIWLSWHNASGILFTVFGVVLVLGGLFLYVLMHAASMEWSTRSLLRIKNFHKYFGYFVSFGAQIAIVTGIMKRVEMGQQRTPMEVFLIILSQGFFFVILILCEMKYQYRESHRGMVAFTGGFMKKSMSR